MLAENHPLAELAALTRPPSTRPPASQRALRAVGVMAAWAFGVLPALVGQRCSAARLFHRPCPGCGMTRAVRFFLAGDFGASFHMHPLALPMLALWAAVMGTTVWTTWTSGTPLAALEGRSGRRLMTAVVVLYGAAVVLWIARWFGFLGGPVPVD
jgi:hypothetical protein